MNKRQKKTMDKKELAKKKIKVIFSILIAILLVVFLSAYVNVIEIEKQMQQNLADVAGQNAVILESKIGARYRLLNSLAKDLEGITEETIEEEMSYFQVFLDEFQLKRFAICYPGGKTYSTDGEVVDLSYREFYKRGMEGKCSITGVLADAIGQGDPVNVMTIPLYDEDGEVSGVFGLTYDTKALNDSLQIECFNQKGYSCIINENGEIMSAIGSDGLELSHNIIGAMLEADAENKETVEKLQNLMAKKEAGSGKVYLKERLYYYIVPVDLMDGCVTWYVLTLVPSEVLSQRILPIQNNQYVSVLLVMLLVAIGAFLMVISVKEQNRQRLRLAYEDPLTKGANYTKFYAEMEKKHDHNGCLIAMDIANFNNVSVVAGEASGNRMIKEVWEIIFGALKDGELAAHISGDAFLLFLTEKNEKVIIDRMEAISEAIGEKAKDFDIYGVRARYGMYQMSEKEDTESAYNRAELAKEYAVAGLGQNYGFYSEVDRLEMQHKKQLEDSFPQAIANKEFEVWYQPKYSAKDGVVVGSEALVRWRSENGNMISPGEFIPLFESNGMIVKLDEYMFRSVCRQQREWLDRGWKICPVSVNISRASLYGMEIHKRYKNILQEYELSPEYIQIEVTETVMEEREDIFMCLNKFRDIGIQILMDDFGTGYSSLATLSLQCFDTLKLDKSLIDRIGNKDGEIMLSHIIHMGQEMGLHITAEGVEEYAQVEYLKTMKCDDVQGFYFSRPIPVKEYETILEQYQKDW